MTATLQPVFPDTGSLSAAVEEFVFRFPCHLDAVFSGVVHYALSTRF